MLTFNARVSRSLARSLASSFPSLFSQSSSEEGSAPLLCVSFHHKFVQTKIHFFYCFDLRRFTHENENVNASTLDTRGMSLHFSCFNETNVGLLRERENRREKRFQQFGEKPKAPQSWFVFVRMLN